jgi:hypothetical protein
MWVRNLSYWTTLTNCYSIARGSWVIYNCLFKRAYLRLQLQHPRESRDWFMNLTLMFIMSHFWARVNTQLSEIAGLIHHTISQVCWKEVSKPSAGGYPSSHYCATNGNLEPRLPGKLSGSTLRIINNKLPNTVFTGYLIRPIASAS